MVLRKMDGCEIMDLDRFMEIVETEEYEVKEIKPFLDFLFNCNYNELCDYLVGFNDYRHSSKLIIFMNTLINTLNGDDMYYQWFIQSLMKDISDDDILYLHHRSDYLLWNVIKIINDGRIALVYYPDNMVYECKNYFDLLNKLEEFDLFEDYYINLKSIIYKIKNYDFIDFGEYRNSKK